MLKMAEFDQFKSSAICQYLLKGYTKSQAIGFTRLAPPLTRNIGTDDQINEIIT
jgi:hypothetical protein